MLVINDATLRDVSYICANLREDDRREIGCMLDPEDDPAKVAQLIAMHSTFSWVAVRNGQPIAAFGAAPANYVVWHLWAFGTSHLWRAIPAISKHFYRHGADMIALGMRRLEARVWKAHDLAPLWLEATGCRYVTDLSDHGRSGEVFQLWEWTATDYLNGSMHTRRGASRHVRVQATASIQGHETSSAPAAA